MKKRSDGRYVKKITDPKTKKSVYIYGKSMAEINRKLLSYESATIDGRTFKEVADVWLSMRYDTYAAQSLKGVIPAHRRAVETFGEIFIKNITPKDVIEYLSKLADLGFTRKTISNHKIIIKQIFDLAIIEGDIQMNPCVSVKNLKGAESTKRTAAAETDEEKILNSNDAWIFPLIALCTGMRKGEILALQWRDVNFEKGTISVTKSVYHVGHQPMIKTPKTENGIRTVPLVSRLRQVLEPLRSDPNLYIIGGDRPLCEYEYAKAHKEYMLRTGITASAHQIRHSFATRLNENGVDGKVAQSILGHAQLSTTMDIYTDFRTRSIDSLKAKLDSSFEA